MELGALEIEATAVGEDSTYNRIINMVKEAEENQAPIISLANKFASYYIPIILLAGIVTFAFTRDTLRMASVFIIACPCALTLGTPTAIVASIGNAARKGILIRNGESLEKLGTADTLVLDKTGTITAGKPSVSKIVGFHDFSEKEVLRIAAGAEKHSEHPVAKAIMTKTEEEGVIPIECSEFKVYPGLGVCVTRENEVISVGSGKMMKENSIFMPEEANSILELDEATSTAVFIALDNRIVGSILVSDTLRDDAENVFSEVEQNGAMKIIMLTGDRKAVAESVGREVGIDDVVADLLPSQKMEYITGLQENGGVVVMVGDGINDAPALAKADVGVAMGLTGTDIAIETAGITLATNNLDRIPKLFRIGRATMKIIKLNIGLALVVNLLGIILSALGFISPLIASMIHEGNSLLVLLNALRLLRID